MVSIIIVTWNSAKYIGKCLESVGSQSFRDREVIVVDNGSTDGTARMIVGCGMPVRLIANSENVGFARANNQAIEIAGGDYILTLNPDVVLTPDYLALLMRVMESSKEIGAVGGKLLRPRENIVDSAGLVRTRARRFKDRGEGTRDRGQYEEPCEELFGVCAAAALYRSEMLAELRINDEYFDPLFFAYFEDVDLAWRGGSAGWKMIYCGLAVAYHDRGGSNIPSKYKQYLAYRNRLYMLVKNDRLSGMARDLPFIFSYDAARLLFLLFTNPVCLKGIVEMFIHIRELIKKRRHIMDKSVNASGNAAPSPIGRER